MTDRPLPFCPLCRSAQVRRATALYQCEQCGHEWNDTTGHKQLSMPIGGVLPMDYEKPERNRRRKRPGQRH